MMLTFSKIKPPKFLALIILFLSGYASPAAKINHITNAPVISIKEKNPEDDYKASYYRMIVDVPSRGKYHINLKFKNYNLPSEDAVQREVMGLIKISDVKSGEVLRIFSFPHNEAWIGGCVIQPPEFDTRSTCFFNLGNVYKGKYLITLEVDAGKINLKDVSVLFSRSL